MLSDLILNKGFIATHAVEGSLFRYARKQDDSLLIVSLASGNWMHNANYKMVKQGSTLDTLQAYLEKLT